MSSRFPYGSRLRAARTNAGVSVEQLALTVGRTAYSIHAYERGISEPPLHVLLAIADEVGVTVDELTRPEAVAS